jgi:hypothetical protein
VSTSDSGKGTVHKANQKGTTCYIISQYRNKPAQPAIYLLKKLKKRTATIKLQWNIHIFAPAKNKENDV